MSEADVPAPLAKAIFDSALDLMDIKDARIEELESLNAKLVEALEGYFYMLQDYPDDPQLQLVRHQRIDKQAETVLTKARATKEQP